MSEENIGSPNSKVKNSLIHIILYIVIVTCATVFLPKIITGDFFGNKAIDTANKAIDAAEKYVNQQVYKSLGMVCDKYDSDIIYKDGDIQLISIKFYTKGSSVAGGSYCVYCKYGYVVSSTAMMGAEYSYKTHVEELKALFGI